MDAVFRGANCRIFFNIAAKNHVDGSLCVGTFVSSLVSFGGSAFLVPRPSFRVASYAIVFSVDDRDSFPSSTS